MVPIKSSSLDKTSSRLSGLKSISPTLDFGDDMNVTVHEAELNAVTADISDYNTSLANLKAKSKAVRNRIAALKKTGARFDNLVIGKYTKESEEYAKIGGKSPSEKKRRGSNKSAKKS